MGFFEFPHTRTYDNDLGWLIAHVIRMSKQLENFINLNTIKYADPIAWNITTQYEANTVVIDPVNGTAYISTHPVPSGVLLTNTDYWTPIFNYGESLENLEKQIVLQYEGDGTTATFPHTAGELFWWRHGLYETIYDFPEGTALLPDVNIRAITVEEFERANYAALDAFIQNVQMEKLSIVGTTVDMRSGDYKAGEYVRTLGYYAIGDGGESYYKIVETPPAQLHYESLENGLYAEFVYYTYVTPQMFGARCDSVTDDAAALQRAVTHSHLTGVPVLLTRSLLINSTITVPSQVRIGAWTNNDVTPFIFMGDSCTLALHFVTVRNIVDGIGVAPLGLVYRDGTTAMEFDGGTGHNVDASVEHVSIAYVERAIDVYGRNLKINDCSFSHTRIGVSYRTSVSDLRGLQIENSRFHGIGEEAALNWFDDSCAIYIMHNNRANVTIRNNIFDQGGTVLNGYASNILFSNNFIESYKANPIMLGFGSGSITPADYGLIVISDNLFRGKQGSVAQDVTVPYPNHLIALQSISRVSIINNSLTGCGKEAISIDTASRVKVSGNTFLATGLSGSGEAALLISGAEVIFTDNMNANAAAMAIVDEGAVAGRIYLADNADFAPPALTLTALMHFEFWRTVGTFSANTSVNLSNFPDEFIAELADGTAFHIFRHGTHFTDAIAWDSNTTFYRLKFTTDTSVTPPTVEITLRKYDVTNWNAGTAYGYSITLYEKIKY